MSDVIRLGIAGTGRMAASMVQAVALTPGLVVQAVASGQPDRAKWFADACGVQEAMDTAAQMAASDSVDAIYVAGRTRDHAAVAQEALRAGKPVLVEKPLAADPDEARALIAAARKADCLLMENLWCLALPAYRALAEQLGSGSYGTPLHLHFDFGYPVQPDSYPSLFDAQDGGAILDRGVYGVSLALQFLGPVAQVDCVAQTDGHGVDLLSDIRLRHESGATSHVAVALNALMSNTASLACTHGCLGLGAPVVGSEVLQATQMLPQAAAQAVPGNASGLKDRIRAAPFARRLKRRRDMSGGRFLAYGANPYLPVLAHFTGLIRAGQAESDLIPLDLSLRTQEVLQQARRQAFGE